ncbi:hypothetical protein [Saccharibacillus sacchari]|uniref:hypothetical protein n=1 Tax=Saccharibacillus sacchari TaxID=456493 RepID=UPI00055B1993|nr:hypothetical protein [Saccharibacillus sacchari]
MGDKHNYYKLLVTWRSPKHHTSYAVGTLELQSDYYQFYYNQHIYKEAVKEGFEPFVGLSDVELIYRSSKLFPSFERRIPNKTRNDFKRFLKQENIVSSNVEWEYLRITKGRLATDSIFFVTPIIYDPADEIALLNVELNGWSWAKNQVGNYDKQSKVSVIHNATYPNNPEAMEIVLDDRSELRLGYIPKPFQTFFYRMQAAGSSIDVRIMAKSPKDGSPVVLLMCKMNQALFIQNEDLHYMLDIQHLGFRKETLHSSSLF